MSCCTLIASMEVNRRERDTPYTHKIETRRINGIARPSPSINNSVCCCSSHSIFHIVCELLVHAFVDASCWDCCFFFFLSRCCLLLLRLCIGALAIHGKSYKHFNWFCLLLEPQRNSRSNQLQHVYFSRCFAALFCTLIIGFSLCWRYVKQDGTKCHQTQQLSVHRLENCLRFFFFSCVILPRMDANDFLCSFFASFAVEVAKWKAQVIS